MLRSLFFNHVAQTNPAPHIFEVSKGQGIYLYDKAGTPFVDLISGISVSSFGHGHPKIIEAIKRQAELYLHTMVYGEHIQSPQVKLAQALTNTLPEPLDNVYFVSSGSECTEAAMKIAKKYTQRKGFVACTNAYHGSTHGPLSLMNNEYYSGAYRPLLPNVKFIELNNEESLNVIDLDTAAVFLETVQGEAGIQIPSNTFMKALRDKCTNNGALLVLDEIQTGMGRTGKLWGFQHYNISPDIMLVSKAFGGGMPLGGVVSSKAIMSAIVDNPILGHITTFGGHPVSCAASMAALQLLLETDLIESVQEKSKLFIEQIDHPNIKEIRSLGFMMAIDLGDSDKVKTIVNFAMEHNILIDWFLYDENSIRISPPLTINEAEIAQICVTFKKGFDLLN